MDLPCRSSRVTNSALLGDPFRDAPRNYETTAVDLKWGASLKLRYAGRPAVATERLTGLPDGRLLYRLKRPGRDGTSAVVFERQDFLAKLAVLTPAPRAHLTRYHGVLGPAAAWRQKIIPTAVQSTGAINANSERPAEASLTALIDAESKPNALGRNHTWA